MRRQDRLLVLAFGLAAAISQLHLLTITGALSPSLVAAQLAFTPAAYSAVLKSWGDAGMQAYRAHLPWDMLHPLLYGAFGYLLASRTPSLSGAHGLRWLLPLAAVFDYGENFSQLHLLYWGVPYNAAIVAFSACCSTAKWLLVAAFIVGVPVEMLKAGKAPAGTDPA